MHAFTEKPKAAQHATAARSTTSVRGHFGHSHEVNSILHLQRTVGNQAVQRMLEASAEDRKRDGYAREADSIAGKFGTPLPDGGPWVEISGNDGPETKTDAGVPTGGGSAAAAPKLSKKTVSGPTASDCGGFKWVVQWELDKKTTTGGWVVQKVELPYNVKDCSDKAVDPKKVGGLTPSWYPLWEAWQINKDQQVTTYAEGGDVEDDTYGTTGTGSDTKGTVTVKGTAEYYDGLTLPSSFKVTNKAPTWILPATNSAPTLSGGTGAISHDLTATWDCCSKDKAATKDTKIETV